MAKSPLCQKFVVAAIELVRERWIDAYLVHFMDNILLAHPNYDDLHTYFKDLKFHLVKFGLVVVQEKIQLQYAYSNLTFSFILKI